MSMLSAAFALKEVTGGEGGSTAASVQQQRNVPMQQPYQQQSTPMMVPGQEQQQPSPMMMARPPSQPMYQRPMQQQQPPSPSRQMYDAKASNTAAPPLVNEGNVTAGSQPMPAASMPNYTKPRAQEGPPNVGPPTTQKQPPIEQAKSKQLDEKQATSSPKRKQKPPPEEEFEAADSALPQMIMSLFTIFFTITTFFIIKVPFRVGSMIFTFWVSIVALRVLWLLLADDNGAWEMGAGVDYEYNMPGLY